jgi:heat shock protein HspQ
MENKVAKFTIGQIVKHRKFPFRGVIYDIDPEFSNSEDWYNSIPEEIRPERNQPFYHIFAENEETHYDAYVSEQNLMLDESDQPIYHPAISEVFGEFDTDMNIYRTNNRLN